MLRSRRTAGKAKNRSRSGGDYIITRYTSSVKVYDKKHDKIFSAGAPDVEESERTPPDERKAKKQQYHDKKHKTCAWITRSPAGKCPHAPRAQPGRG